MRRAPSPARNSPPTLACDAINSVGFGRRGDAQREQPRRVGFAALEICRRSRPKSTSLQLTLRDFSRARRPAAPRCCDQLPRQNKASHRLRHMQAGSLRTAWLASLSQRPTGRIWTLRNRIPVAKRRGTPSNGGSTPPQRGSAAVKPRNTCAKQSRKCNLYLADFEASCPRSKWGSL